MLTKEQIEANKQEFLSEINKITRPNSRISDLVSFLENYGFFNAPASSVYHNAFEGGLCEHSLNVLANLRKLCNIKQIYTISEESIIIVALLHDISKFDFYEPFIKNEKVYSDSGDKYDNMGKFSWVAKKGYKVVDSRKRFVFGTHGQNSQYLINQFIPLTIEESAAIINHMGQSNDAAPDLTAIYNAFSLACLLHIADMLATYIDERNNGDE